MVGSFVSCLTQVGLMAICTSGFRKCLQKEFASIYVFNLRGDARTKGEQRRKEAGNVFGDGSRSPIAISLLVKRPGQGEQEASIQYYDIGDYLTGDEKKDIIQKFHSIETPQLKWKKVSPNNEGDWISQRNRLFETFLPIGNKDTKPNKGLFNEFYSRGLASARDAWCYNSSKRALILNIKKFIAFYDEQRINFHKKIRTKPELKAEDFISFDSKSVTWNRGLKGYLEQDKEIHFSKDYLVRGIYRPFFKQNLYFSRDLNDMVYQLPKLFPKPNVQNIVICVSGTTDNFSVIAADTIPDLHFNGDTQCFPLYYYEQREKQSPTLLRIGNR